MFSRVVLIWLGVLAVIGVLIVGGFAIRWATAPVRGKLQAREQVQSGNFRLEAYNHFYDLCAAIQNQEGALAAQYEALASATTSDQKDRINTNIAGLKAFRATSINQYNVDARKSGTIAQFKASDLPFHIDTSEYRKGVSTSCVS